jgi:RNA 3'-terminal phosphate cyclase-like protein
MGQALALFLFMSVLNFEGSSYLRQRILCSVLSSKPVKITKIRADEKTPGLADFEISLLRLIDKITNGTKIEIDFAGMKTLLLSFVESSGTSLFFSPGMLIGGKLKHDCPNSRGIGYFLEALVVLAPFGKSPLSIVLTGVTNHNDNLDISV